MCIRDSSRFISQIDVGSESVVSLVDLDADGDLDLFVTNKIDPQDLSDSKVFLFRNNGKSTAPDFQRVGEFKLEGAYHNAPAFGDLDADGDLDIVLGTWRDELRYLQNVGSETQPDFKLIDPAFVEITRGSNATPTLGDIDNDGDLDVYVTNIGKDGLYLNEGGVCTRAPAAALVSSDDCISSASFLDYDRDGDLDLFVCHYLQDNPERICRTSLKEKRDYCGPDKFQGVRDSLYRNEGNGRFSNVTVEAGISRALPGFGVICFDLTGDGWVDIYVANDMKPNQLWVNRRDGTFTDEALARGLALNGAGKQEAGMGVALGDVDGDGRLDLFITHLADQTHTLYTAAETGSGLTYRDRSVSYTHLTLPTILLV